MKSTAKAGNYLLVLLTGLTGLVFLSTGCSTGKNVGITNAEQPLPVIGRGIGVTAGAVSGNAVAGVVSVGEGFGGAFKSSFDNSQRVVRRWRPETTPDGRDILVPEDILIDENSRVIRKIQ